MCRYVIVFSIKEQELTFRWVVNIIALYGLKEWSKCPQAIRLQHDTIMNSPCDLLEGNISRKFSWSSCSYVFQPRKKACETFKRENKCCITVSCPLLIIIVRGTFLTASKSIIWSVEAMTSLFVHSVLNYTMATDVRRRQFNWELYFLIFGKLVYHCRIEKTMRKEIFLIRITNSTTSLIKPV